MCETYGSGFYGSGTYATLCDPEPKVLPRVIRRLSETDRRRELDDEELVVLLAL